MYHAIEVTSQVIEIEHSNHHARYKYYEMGVAILSSIESDTSNLEYKTICFFKWLITTGRAVTVGLCLSVENYEAELIYLTFYSQQNSGSSSRSLLLAVVVAQ